MSVLTETIFAHAVALHQGGRLKNTIHICKNDVFILNTDNTVLLRFELPKNAEGPTTPISFSADDYDSDIFREEDGKIVFVQEKSGFTRTKTCGVPKIDFKGVENMYWEYFNHAVPHGNHIELGKPVLDLLDDGLSHVEVSGQDGKAVIVQRDIYTGSIIRLERKDEGLGLAAKVLDQITTDFGPMGLRTDDLFALFSFNKIVKFQFANGDPDGQSYCYVKGDVHKMTGIVAGCLYDELGTTQKSKEATDGRKVKEKRQRQQKATSKAVNGNEEKKGRFSRK